MHKVAVVIPTYKEELNPLEKISLDRCRKVLGRYPLIFVAPAGKNFSYVAPADKVIGFPPQFFQSVAAYSRLLMSPQFYDAFREYEYILIYQLDAFVFYDALEYFCSLGYDYIGAPWPRMYMRKPYSCSNVGNGGFSLRNVKAHYELLCKRGDLLQYWIEKQFPEDTFFSHCGKRGDCNFNVAPVNVASKFSAEFNPPRVVRKNGGKIPFGCHAWHGYNSDFYVPIFAQSGYDLRPFQKLLLNHDGGLRNWLLNVAHRRLIRRLERGQNISHYLPPRNHYTSIRALRSSVSMMILTRLLTENPRLADEIFLYDEDDRDVLLSDLTAKREPHLLIDSGDSTHDLLQAATQRGLAYGKRVVYFWQEYFGRCEKNFRNLGK